MSVGVSPVHVKIEGAARVRRLLLVAALAFVTLVSLRFHGFSLPAWHDVLDGSPAREVLLGTPARIRSDDWAVHLPLALAQASHEPRFPVVNENVGRGQNMVVPFSYPVAHPVTLFRPTVWGFFLGNDVGLAWMWWTQSLGCFAVWLLVFLVVTGQRLGLSVGLCALVLFSPFFQFWSLNAAPVATYAGLVFLAAATLLSEARPRAIWASGGLLGWAAGCFLLVLYPPYQIPLAYLMLVLLAWLVWERRGLLREQSRTRAAAAALAAGVATVAVVALYHAGGDAIEQIRETVYPGARRVAGGDEPLWEQLNSNLWTALYATRYGALQNICEAASFWLLFPAVGAGVVVAWVRRWRSCDALVAALTLTCAVLSLYCAVGFSDSLAGALFLGRVPSSRALLALGLADALLLGRWLSLPAGPEPGRAARAVVALAWVGLLAACAQRLRTVLGEGDPVWLGVLVLANGILAYLVLARWRPELVVAAMAAGLWVCTVGFNPLVRGGSDYLRHNPVAAKILEIDHRAGGETVWASVGQPYAGNLFRAIGVRGVDGVHVLPQLELWKSIDPAGAQRSAYDRFAHVVIAFEEGPRFEAVTQDALLLRVDPAGDVLTHLGVTHLLVRDRPSTPLGPLETRKVAQVGRYSIVELPRATSATR